MAHPVAGAAAAGFLLVSAWGAPAPVDIRGLGFRVCAPVPPGGVVLVGGPVLQPGPPVVLQHVRLLDPSGVEVVHAWVVPTAEGAMGSSEVPPVGFPPWRVRVTAAGAVLTGGEEQQVLVELARTAGDTGEVRGLALSYSAGGHVYVTAGPLQYRVRDACS